MYQVHLWRAEEQASYPGHPPAAVPEGSRSDSGPQGGESQTLLHAQYLPSYKRNAPVHVCFTLQHNWASCKNHSYEHAVVHIQVIHSFPQTCRMKPVQVVLSLIRTLFFYSINTTPHAHVSVFLIRYCWVACTSKMKIKINQLHTKVTLFLNKSQ